jgi:hypothetical protein
VIVLRIAFLLPAIWLLTLNLVAIRTEQPVVPNGKAKHHDDRTQAHVSSKETDPATTHADISTPKRHSEADEKQSPANDRIYKVDVVSQPTPRHDPLFITYLVITGMGVLVGVGTLFVVWRQRNVMLDQLQQMQASGKQTDQMIEQSRNTAGAALLNAQAVINSQRAWLFPQIKRVPYSDGYTKAMGQFELCIENYGKTPAHLISVNHYSQILLRDDRLPASPDYRNNSEFESTMVLVPGGSYLVDDIELSFMWWFNQERELDDGRKVIYQYGLIRYQDVLPNSPVRQTAFCYRYFRNLQDWRVSGPREYTSYT